MAEKRKHPRRRIKRPLFYFCESDAPGQRGRIYYPGTVVDSSPGGLGLLTGHPHTCGERLWFEALGKLQPRIGDRPVAGIVRWLEKGDGQYRMGVELTGD